MCRVSPGLIVYVWDLKNNKECTCLSCFSWDSSKFYPRRICDDLSKVFPFRTESLILVLRYTATSSAM